jgi:hypothetical protein
METPASFPAGADLTTSGANAGQAGEVQVSVLYHDDAQGRQCDTVDNGRKNNRRLELAEREKSPVERFHEGVVVDDKAPRAALKVAGYILHVVRPKGDRFSLSVRQAMKYLKASRSRVQSGLRYLEESKRLYRLDKERINAKGAFNPRGRYSFRNPIKDTASVLGPGAASVLGPLLK